MRANPGGQIPLSEVIGRESLIQRLWRILERQSVVLSAERRMGKTSVVKKMVGLQLGNKLSVYQDLEGVRTPLEFVEAVFNDVENYLSRSKRTASRARKWLAHLTGLEIAGIVKFPATVSQHWKSLLIKTVEDLVEEQDYPIIFFWDEMPLMLYNIKRREGEAAAMEILDTLRSLRQTHPKLRMVFTGSIGLHNVLTSLKRAGYANDPTNDMNTVDVPPLSSDDAKKLAQQLLKGENVSADHPEAAANAIASAVDNIPFFIHHVVDQIVQRGVKANADVIAEIVNASLTDPQDPWHLRYYRERISTYYTADEQSFALNLLDILSVADLPMPFNELFNLLKTRLTTEDQETVRDVLTLLQRDHYIIQQTDGAFRFRFPLIQRYWRLHRGVS